MLVLLSLERSELSVFFFFLLNFYFVQEFDLTNERFLVPEMLFRPADLGLVHILFFCNCKVIYIYIFGFIVEFIIGEIVGLL